VLHFLIGVAVCLFIGERLVHYWSAYRRERDVRRGLELLRPPPPPAPPPPRVPRRHFLETDFGRYAVFCVWFLVIVTFLGCIFEPYVVG
jgi:hypothetical protein